MHQVRERTVVVWVALAATTSTTVGLLCTVQWLTGAERAALVIASLASWILLVVLGWRLGSLPVRPIIAAIALTLVCAVVTPSHQSKDVYSYVMYGRMVTVHHASPYDNYPMHFEGDPMRHYVSQMWQRTPDVYGPAFTSVMVALAPVIGTSTFLTHFLYQLIAAIAVALLLWLLWRRTHNALVLAFVGLHPLAAVSVVNGGHPDALIALAFCAGYFLALDRRVLVSALAFAFGIAINFSVVVVAAALGAWALRRWSRRDVVKFGVIAFGLGAFPYALLAGWLGNAHEHQQLISRESIWNPIGSIISANTSTLKTIMPGATTLVAGALVLVVLWRLSRWPTPAPAITAAFGVFLVTSPWVMPWYAFAALPFIALRKPGLLGWCIALYSAFILVGDQFESLSPAAVGSFTHTLLQNGVPLMAGIACVVAIFARTPVRERDIEPLAAPVLARAG